MEFRKKRKLNRCLYIEQDTHFSEDYNGVFENNYILIYARIKRNTPSFLDENGVFEGCKN